MENSEGLYRGMDPQQLLRREVQTLSQRVEALIKWTEDYEESAIFFGKKDNVNNKEEKSNFESTAGNEIPSLVNASKLDEKDENDVDVEVGSMPEEREGNQVDNTDDMDLFGASCSFGDLKGEMMEENNSSPSPNKVSLLEWD